MNRIKLQGDLLDIRERQYETEVNGVFHISAKNGSVQRVKLLSNTTVHLPRDVKGESLVLIIEPNTYTVSWGGGTLEWLTSDGAAPTLVTTANLVNVVTFIPERKNRRWLGFLAGKETT